MSRRFAVSGVSGQQHGMVALDADGVPVYPAKLWCDTETSAQNSDLRSPAWAVKQGAWRSWGWRYRPAIPPLKSPWLREHQPDAYRRIDSLLLPDDYLNFWLTGERVTEEAGDASGTGVF